MKKYLYYYLTNEGEQGNEWAKDFNSKCIEADSEAEAIEKAEALIGKHQYHYCSPFDYDEDEWCIRLGLRIDAGLAQL